MMHERTQGLELCIAPMVLRRAAIDLVLVHRALQMHVESGQGTERLNDIRCIRKPVRSTTHL